MHSKVISARIHYPKAKIPTLPKGCLISASLTPHSFTRFIHHLPKLNFKHGLSSKPSFSSSLIQPTPTKRLLYSSVITPRMLSRNLLLKRKLVPLSSHTDLENPHHQFTHYQHITFRSPNHLPRILSPLTNNLARSPRFSTCLFAGPQSSFFQTQHGHLNQFQNRICENNPNLQSKNQPMDTDKCNLQSRIWLRSQSPVHIGLSRNFSDNKETKTDDLEGLKLALKDHIDKGKLSELLETYENSQLSKQELEEFKTFQKNLDKQLDNDSKLEEVLNMFSPSQLEEFIQEEPQNPFLHLFSDQVAKQANDAKRKNIEQTFHNNTQVIEKFDEGDTEEEKQQFREIFPELFKHNEVVHLLEQPDSTPEMIFEKLEEAIQLAPENFEFYTNKGALFLALGADEEALEWFEKSLEINSATNCRAYYNKTIALNSLERYEEALECFNKINEIDPKYLEDDIEALCNLGSTYHFLKRYQYTIYFKSSFTCVGPLLLIFNFFSETKNETPLREARSLFEKCLEKEPYFMTARENLAETEEELMKQLYPPK